MIKEIIMQSRLSTTTSTSGEWVRTPSGLPLDQYCSEGKHIGETNARFHLTAVVPSFFSWFINLTTHPCSFPHPPFMLPSLPSFIPPFLLHTSWSMSSTIHPSSSLRAYPLTSLSLNLLINAHFPSLLFPGYAAHIIHFSHNFSCFLLHWYTC